MEIKITINDDDYAKFSKNTLELGIDPLDTIEMIIVNTLKEKNLRAEIKKKQKTLKDDILNDFENNMKKYRIFQSSIAHCLNTTQASISRALKYRYDDLCSKIYNSGKKILVDAYIYQNSYDLNYSHPNINGKIKNSLINCATKKIKQQLGNDSINDGQLRRLFDTKISEMLNSLNDNNLDDNIEEFVKVENHIVEKILFSIKGYN